MGGATGRKHPLSASPAVSSDSTCAGHVGGRQGAQASDSGAMGQVGRWRARRAGGGGAPGAQHHPQVRNGDLYGIKVADASFHCACLEGKPSMHAFRLGHNELHYKWLASGAPVSVVCLDSRHVS